GPAPSGPHLVEGARRAADRRGRSSEQARRPLGRGRACRAQGRLSGPPPDRALAHTGRPQTRTTSREDAPDAARLLPRTAWWARPVIGVGARSGAAAFYPLRRFDQSTTSAPPPERRKRRAQAPSCAGVREVRRSPE